MSAFVPDAGPRRPLGREQHLWELMSAFAPTLRGLLAYTPVGV